MTTSTPLLQISDLAVSYRGRRHRVDAVQGVSLSIESGQTVALVGESGSGKSTTAHAVLQLLAPSASITGGSIALEGTELTTLSQRRLREYRGRRIGLIPQDPTVSLNPVVKIGTQVAEVLRVHGLADRHEAHGLAIEALAAAGLDDPELRALQYPHELSGGLRQRVLIAIATVARPSLIIADEPTSALDVTVQRQILDHISTLTRESGSAVLLVTHDLGVAADRADLIAVMSQGRTVETGTPVEVLTDPQHPYTRTLISAAPSLRTTASPAVVDAPAEQTAAPLVVAEHLVKDFHVPRSVQSSGTFRAVDDVSFAIARGRTLALVGESGSGKSTTARLVLGLLPPTSGSIDVDGTDLTQLSRAQLRALRRRIQVVQQNPYASLDPKLTVGQAITEPLHALRIGNRTSRRQRTTELLDAVGLPTSYAERRPAELSGGQRQRVAIARALTVRPELVVLDEPVSALDVRVQSQILDLLTGLQTDLGVSYLFISHDLAVVRQVAHEIAVMRRGRIVEAGTGDQVLTDPQHPYTRALLEAIPGTAVEPSLKGTTP